MAYTPTDWATGDVLTEVLIDKMETGISDAHTHIANTANPHDVTAAQAGAVAAGNASTLYVGRIDDDGTAVTLPAGWTSTRLSMGSYRVTHNLGSANYVVIAMAHDITNTVSNSDPSPTSDLNSFTINVPGTDAVVDFMLSTY